MSQQTQAYTSESPADLPKLAGRFFEQHSKPGIFMIHGEMGAGKTTFVAALCNKLGFEFQGSPTFSLVNEYLSPQNKVFHFDLYRIKNEKELLEFGFEEYLRDGYWVFIEWPEMAKPFLPENTCSITLEDHGDHRLIRF